MRITFVNRYFHPDHSATAQLLTDLAFGLAKRGWSVTVVAGGQLYDDPTVRLPRRETLDGVDVIRVGATRFGRARLIGRASDYASFVIGAAFALLRTLARGDLVVCKTDPPLLGAWLAPVIRWRGARLVQWMQDVFPEVASALGVGNRVPALHAILSTLRDASLERSAAIVAIGERMRAKLIERGADPHSTHAIPNWTDCTAIAPVARETNELRKSWNLDDKFVVGYSGNLGRVHALDGLLEAASLLVERRDIVFLFVGSGAQRAYLEQQAIDRRLANMRFQPYQPREALARSLSVPDVHVVSLKPEVEGLVVPSKLYSALAVGRPVLSLGAIDGEVSMVVTQHECGMVCAPDGARAIAEALVRLADDVDAREAMGKRARAASLAFDRGRALDQWCGVLDSLNAQPRTVALGVER